VAFCIFYEIPPCPLAQESQPPCGWPSLENPASQMGPTNGHPLAQFKSPTASILPSVTEFPMTDPQTSFIAATLKEYPLCRQIILFLVENESAMDTVKGIAACWVDCDEVAVQAALDRLLTCGAVIAHTLTSGTLYGLTRNQATRTWLSGSLGAWHRRWAEAPQSTGNLVS
jgi:hypothetical protein